LASTEVRLTYLLETLKARTPPGGQPVEVELESLARQQVHRRSVAAEGVDDQDVIASSRVAGQ